MKGKLLPITILFLIISILVGCGGKTQSTGTTQTAGTSTESQASLYGEGNIKVTSSAFKNNGAIPERHARQGAGGENVSIPLEWQGAPEGTKSFAFTMVDISARNWVHWLVVDIPAKTTSIAEGASNKRMPDGSKELINTFGDIGYGGPQPPPGSGPHKYVITVYALSEEGLDLPQQISYDDFLRALEGKVLAKASIIGKYSR